MIGAPFSALLTRTTSSACVLNYLCIGLRLADKHYLYSRAYEKIHVWCGNSHDLCLLSRDIAHIMAFLKIKIPKTRSI